MRYIPIPCNCVLRERSANINERRAAELAADWHSALPLKQHGPSHIPLNQPFRCMIEKYTITTSGRILTNLARFPFFSANTNYPHGFSDLVLATICFKFTTLTTSELFHVFWYFKYSSLYMLRIYWNIRITIVGLTLCLFALLFFERNFRYRNP